MFTRTSVAILLGYGLDDWDFILKRGRYQRGVSFEPPLTSV
jgi:hypothetical protein